MTEDSTHTVYADRITFNAPNDPRPVLGVVQDGWEWVELPKPSRWKRFIAWCRGEVLPTEELKPRYVIGIRQDMFADGSISAAKIGEEAHRRSA